MSNQVFSGKYIVQEVLAKGGMGVIYKALDQTLNRVVVIKAVHEHLSGDPSFTARFLREARAMARLDHDNIVTIHAVEEERGTPYIVMEYFPGGNLRSFMQARNPLHLRTSVEIALQVAEALAYAHDQGIIHRDIKPANILVDGRGRVKLTDFGIAAALDEVSITTVGQIIGTPEYMSPEQAAGRRVDGRADLYSLGIVLYEMIVGHHPFRNIPKSVIHSKLLDTQEEIPLGFPENTPSLVKAIIEDLVRRDPEYRMPTARFLVTQLKECLQTLPPLPESPAEEPTILVTPHTARRTEPGMVPPVPSEPLYPFPSDPDVLSRKGVDRSDHAPAGAEEKTDVTPRPNTQSKPETLHLPESIWRRYNVLPLVIMTLATAVVLGGLVFFLSRGEWSRSPEPSTPPQEDRTIVPPRSDRVEVVREPDKSSDGQASKERDKSQAKVAPEPQPAIRPPSPKKPITPSRQQLDRLLEDFQAAYEAQDLSALQRLSEISADRQMFLDIMINNYSIIKVSIQNISIKNDQATATLIHEELVDKNGEPVAPDKILRTVRLTVRKDGDRWSKVFW
ncbi:MAG: protein kinase [Nitrospira defluvii]|nr:protein kinase [Nitrospira defluvii]